jgi:ankyrin repeat protein
MGSLRSMLNAEKRQLRLDNLLFETVRIENINEVVRLLAMGAESEARTEGDGETPLMWACEPTSLDIMEVLLERGAKVDTPDNYGVTPLMYSAANHNTNQAYKPLEVLLKHGAAVDLKAHRGTTALMYATEAGQLRCVYRLLKAGADPDLRDDDGYTAYDVAMSDTDSTTHRRIAELLRRNMK